MKTRLLVGLLFSAAALAAVWWQRPAELERSSAASAPVTLGRPATQEASTCLIAPRARHAWSLVTTTSANVTPASIGQGSLATRHDGEHRATVQLEGLSALHDGTTVLARWVGVDAETAAAAPGVEQAPFLFTVSSRCEITAFARHRSTPLAAARAQQATLAQLWFRTPSKDEATTSIGANSLGRFHAVMARDENVVQRRITSYERAWVGADVPTVTDSFLAVELGGVWFESMRGREVVSHGVFSNGRVTLAAHRAVADPSVLEGASHDEREYVWEDLLPRVVRPAASSEAEASRAAADRSLYAMVPLSEAVRSFAASVIAEPNTDAKWRGLSRYFAVHPESIASFVGSMQHPDFPGELKAMGFVAVGHATPVEARDALLAVRNDTTAEPFDRIRASLALVGRSDVGGELASLLRRDAQLMISEPDSPKGFYGRNALLALGMFSALRDNQDPAVTSEARAAITEALEASPQKPLGAAPITFSAAMGAMGNVGDPADLSIIVEWSKHQNPEVRAQVPQAMRRLKQREVAAFTLEWLARETSPEVKQALYGVIQHQLLDEHVTASEALARQAVNDLAAQPTLLTRQPLVRILGPTAATFGFVREALVRQAAIEVGTTSGLYSVISQYVPGEQVAAALAAHPSFTGEGRLLSAVGPPPLANEPLEVTP